MDSQFYCRLAVIITAIFPFLSSSGQPTATPKASFEKIWVDYDVTEDGLRGMRIHLKFTCYQMKELDSYVAIYFKNAKGGDYLKDNNKKYYSKDGLVALYKNVKPAYDEAAYNDLQLFMPYSELDLSYGNYDLEMDVKLIYKGGGVIQKLTTYGFLYKKPQTASEDVGGVPASQSMAPSVVFKDAWFDFETFKSGTKGLDIHVNFTVNNMKGQSGYLAAYFTLKDGTMLYSNNTNYRTKNGQLASFRSILPGYVNAVYDDLSTFLPYDEIMLKPGRYELNVKIELITNDGKLIKSLTSKDIWIQKN